MSQEVVTPRIRGFIATNAHPDGCAANVRQQIEVAESDLPGAGLDNVLVVGSSTGYGLASAISACFGYHAKTLGVCFERPSTEDRGASAGWYNLAEAHRAAAEQGRTLETINGDAFSADVKAQTLDALRSRFGKVDVLIYSLAAPRREDPDGEVWNSVLKPIGAPHTSKTVDLRNATVEEQTFDPADDDEIEATRRVMGGDDWADWVEALQDADLLADGFRTVAYSYIGPAVTRQLYRSGTIGRAKEHLEATGNDLSAGLAERHDGGAWVSVNKAVVTQASAAIPGVPLYLGILTKTLTARGLDESPIEQIVRLFADHIGPGTSPQVDAAGRIRLDDREMLPEVQDLVSDVWDEVTTESLEALADFSGYQRAFRQLFGFEVDGVDYDAATETHRELA
ncbi:MAG TPA: enoyl-ACP reductase FabV [Dehalococcoidia bacterium]|nr:enoyl-ACP reductase FabV [Dehalococcoidia bacterium]